MSDEETRALLLFHALSGCDTVSQPMGIGKKMAWDRWKSMPELTQTFISLLENPKKYSKDTPKFQVLQRYMIHQYAKTSSANNLNEARLQLFSRGKKTLETLPPTVNSYYQHSRRALLQAAYIWDKALPIPDYSQYGWK